MAKRPKIDVRDPKTDEIVTRPMNDEEFAAYGEQVESALTLTRLVAAERVKALLTASDHWAARAFEEGAQMSDARKAYRQALRAALQEIGDSDDPHAVKLPDAPAE